MSALAAKIDLVAYKVIRAQAPIATWHSAHRPAVIDSGRASLVSQTWHVSPVGPFERVTSVTAVTDVSDVTDVTDSFPCTGRPGRYRFHASSN